MDPRLARLELKTSISSIADLVFPRFCVVCGIHLMPYEKHICMDCEEDIPYTRYEKMSHNPMSDSFNALLARQNFVGPYVHATALFHYSGNYKEITRQLKYRRNFSAGKFFSRRFGERLKSSPLYEDVDTVVPVPLHWTRKWRRGYNQADIIAREISGILGAEFCPEALKRRRSTETQTRLSVSGRMENVSGAFVAGKPLRNASHILLVDDVYTTGSTLSVCHKALRETLPRKSRISVATIAFVE